MHRRHAAMPRQAPVVFVVDDGFEVRRALIRLLGDSHHRVYPFARPSDALDRLAELSPDLVISDNDMPDMTGLELLRTIRRAQPEVRTVMLTGSLDEHVHRAHAAGEIDWQVEKPWHNQSLRVAVRELLATPRGTARAARDKRSG